MAKNMFESFQGYDDWQTQVMQVCQNFQNTYGVYPKFIRVNSETFSAIFSCEEKKQPAGLTKHDRAMLRQYLANVFDYGDEDDFGIYPVDFGPNDDGTVSFDTNRYSLYFLEGEDLPDGYFIVLFGDPPDNDGSDIEEPDAVFVTAAVHSVA